jgi:hypothetical protein
VWLDGALYPAIGKRKQLLLMDCGDNYLVHDSSILPVGGRFIELRYWKGKMFEICARMFAHYNYTRISRPTGTLQSALVLAGLSRMLLQRMQRLLPIKELLLPR